MYDIRKNGLTRQIFCSRLRREIAMATSRPLTTDEKIWCFEVTNPVKHIKGFTIYQVSCKIIHISAPEKITEIVVWKRYNDFKQLYKSMITLHKALHRKEEFPEFAKPKFFGRFAESVIEERRTSALELLNFIGHQQHLYKSQLFQKFLESSENDEFNAVEGRSCPVSIKPTNGGGASNATAETSSFESDSELSLDLSSSDANKSHEVLALNQQDSYTENSQKQENHISLKTSTSASDICNGVWSHPQIPDNISITSMEDEELEELDRDVSVVLGTPLPDADISYFDPLQPNQEEAVSSSHELDTDNIWLLSALATNVLPFTTESLVLDPNKDKMPDKHLEERNSFHQCHSQQASSVASDSKESPAKESDTEKTSQIDISAFDPLEDVSHAKVSYTKGDFDISLDLPPLTTHPSSPERNDSSTTAAKSSASFSPKIQRSRSSSRSSEMSLKVGGKEDYIYVAANQICQAQECEASGRHEMAFAFYRNGVGILLQGVQGDGNKTRREAVRRKTAQYLMKAEELYNRHLAKDSNDDRRWALDCTLSPPMELDPTLAFLRAPLCELRNYKVLGTIDKVLLVLERGTNDTYVMKTIHKSGTERLDVKNILPSFCPFMVQLHKFYEGTDAIYLLLQFALGGKLWKYISSYLQTGAQDNFTDYSASGSAGGRNIYKGCKLHNSSTFHEQLPHYSPKENSPDASITHSKISGFESSAEQNIPNKEKPNSISCVAVFSNKADSEHVQFINTSSKHYSQNILQTKNQAEHPEDNRQNVRAQRCSELSLSESPIDKDVLSANKSESLNMDLGSAGRFQDLLRNTENCLENFIIASDESSEVKSERHSSGFSETISMIPEGTETLSYSPKRDKMDIKSNHLDEVFLSSPQESGEGEEDKPNSTSSKYSPKLIKTSNPLLDPVHNPNEKLCVDSSISVIKTDSAGASATCIHESNDGFDDIESSRDTEPHDANKYTEGLTKVYSSSSKETPFPQNVDKTCKPCSVEALPLCKKNMARPLTPHDQNVSYDVATGNDLAARSQKAISCSCYVARNTEQNMTTHKHSFTEICRSASFESNLKSPSKNKSRRVFEELDGIGNWPSEALLPESCIRNWAAEIVVALAYLHAQGIICRDLKPANVLLGDKGHILITYFCQLNNVDKLLDESAVENMYTAPELRTISSYTEVCDWWSFGALLYELLSGKRLSSSHPGGITSHTQLLIPTHISKEAQGILEELLCYNPRERLGSGINGAEDIKAHPFFAGIDWNYLENNYN